MGLGARRGLSGSGCSAPLEDNRCGLCGGGGGRAAQLPAEIAAPGRDRPGNQARRSGVDNVRTATAPPPADVAIEETRTAPPPCRRPRTGSCRAGPRCSASPNVVAGRIANAFAEGPNLVVDAHRGSLAAALRMAAGWIASGERPLVLAGAIHAAAHPAVAALVHDSAVVPERRPLGEAALLIALAPLGVAAQQGWPVLGLLDHTQGGNGAAVLVGRTGPLLLGADLPDRSGAGSASRRRRAVRVLWPAGTVLTPRGSPRTSRPAEVKCLHRHDGYGQPSGKDSSRRRGRWWSASVLMRHQTRATIASRLNGPSPGPEGPADGWG